MACDDAWRILEPGFYIDHIDTYETLFSLANGNRGMRGDFEEKHPSFHRETYINFFFEKEPITYGEIAYGYAENHETILNIPDARLTSIFLDGEEFRLDMLQLDMLQPAQLEFYERYLDLRESVLIRTVRARLLNKVRIEIKSTQLVSFARPSIAAIK